jgi:outer membrane protein assembly factor BamB
VILRAAVFVALVGLVAGCAAAIPYLEPDSPDRPAEPTPTRAKAKAKPPQRPSRVKVYVVAVDGDTGKRVRTAVARVGAQRDRANRKGLSTLRVRRLAPLPVRVSAPGYLRRTVRVPFHKRRQNTVRIYRRALQWPMYGVTPQRTQAQSRIRLRPPFKVVWSRGIGSLIEFPAVVSEGVAYIANQEGTVYAISMRFGKTIWRFHTPRGKMAASPAIVGDELVVHGMEGNVWVLDRTTGRLRWRYHVGSPIESSPVVRHGVDYFGAWNGTVYALDLKHRRLRWTHRAGFKITSSAAIAGRRLYIGDYGGYVRSIALRTGRVAWARPVGGRIYGTPALASGRVFVPSSTGGSLTAFSTGGHYLWRVRTGSYVYSSPAAQGGRVFFGSYNGRLYAVNARTGRMLWSVGAGGPVSGAAVVVDRVAYAGSTHGNMVGADTRNGRVLFRFPHGEYVPVSGNGSRLLLHGYSRLYAVAPRK